MIYQTDAEQKFQSIYDEAYEVAYAGLPAQNPYARGTTEHRIWIKGFETGKSHRQSDHDMMWN